MTRVQVFREKGEREREKSAPFVYTIFPPVAQSLVVFSPYILLEEGGRKKISKKNFPHFRRMEN